MKVYTILLVVGLVTASQVQAQFIQALVDGAAPGATVMIPPGTYLENVIINKDITLQGAGAGVTIVDGNSSGTVLRIEGGTVSISGLTITHGYDPNFFLHSGGIDNFGSLTLSDSEVIGNVSEWMSGGIANSGTLVMNNCRVSGNEGQEAGGILNHGQATVNSCTIDSNSGGGANGGSGGGLANGALLTLNNSTVSNNEILDSYGGGIGNGGTLTLNHCTIAGNSATVVNSSSLTGGGVMNWGTGTVNCQNTIIAGNFATRHWPIIRTGPGPDFFGTLTSQGYNLIGDTTDTVITGITIGNQLNLDPLLGPLRNNGGFTDTHALLPASPAIDSGISGGLNTDQRGVPRPIDILSLPDAADGSDIGAYEFNLGPAVSITDQADIAVNNDPDQCSAVVNFPAPLVSGGTGNVAVVYNPPSGFAFPVGRTTITCTATDSSGNTAACSFNVTVNDSEPPSTSYTTVRAFQTLPNSLRRVGQFQLLSSDNCDPNSLIYIRDSATGFVAGPFHSGDQVEIAKGPRLHNSQHAPASGPNSAVIVLEGGARMYSVDSAGNASPITKVL